MKNLKLAIWQKTGEIWLNVEGIRTVIIWVLNLHGSGWPLRGYTTATITEFDIFSRIMIEVINLKLCGFIKEDFWSTLDFLKL